jgi:hypothetical protein
MITISNNEVFGKVIAAALASVGENTGLGTDEQKRCVNAIAKAAARTETRGCFMDYEAGGDRMLIWSDSNEIYEIGPDGRCQCHAQAHDIICWHKAAKRIIQRYNEATGTTCGGELTRAEYAA